MSHHAFRMDALNLSSTWCENLGLRSMFRTNKDLVWLTLANFHITMLLTRLLKLVPWFTETRKTILRKEQLLETPIHFVNPRKGPVVLDDQILTLKVVIRKAESVPPLVRKTLVENNQHKSELAEEYD